MKSDAVEKYFSLQAFDYQTKSTHWPWSWIRARESRAICSLLGDVKGSNVLELGSGSGFYTRALIEMGARHVWAVDISEAMLSMLPSGPVTPVLASGEMVRLHERFSVLISAGMLEFVPDPVSVLANAAGHAEAGARFIVLVPVANAFGFAYRRFHQGHGMSIHLFDEKWFATYAPRAGWRADSAKQVFPFSLALRLRRT